MTKSVLNLYSVHCFPCSHKRVDKVDVWPKKITVYRNKRLALKTHKDCKGLPEVVRVRISYYQVR